MECLGPHKPRHRKCNHPDIFWRLNLQLDVPEENREVEFFCHGMLWGYTGSLVTLILLL